MKLCPFANELSRSGRTDLPFHYLAVKRYKRVLPVMLGMKVWRGVIVEEHANDDTEKRGDDRHGVIVPDTDLCCELLPRGGVPAPSGHKSRISALQFVRHRGGSHAACSSSGAWTVARFAHCACDFRRPRASSRTNQRRTTAKLKIVAHASGVGRGNRIIMPTSAACFPFVGRTDLTLSCAAKAHVPKPTRRGGCRRGVEATTGEVQPP
jgi:hypothetical protein